MIFFVFGGFEWYYCVLFEDNGRSRGVGREIVGLEFFLFMRRGGISYVWIVRRGGGWLRREGKV